MIKEIQDSLIESIQIIAREKLKNVNFTKSFVGVVKNINGSKCDVEIMGSEYECIIPHILTSFIGKDDIVVVQDIDNTTRIVQGVISSVNQYIFHIYDPIEDRVISSVEQLWDEELRMAIDVVLEIGE
jgi:2-hydroxy-3-keto-5-methylthiopentenyl-1-phosphate phosphatase